MNKINPNKFYTAEEIEKDSLFPWIGNYRTILTWLQTQVESGKAKRYGIIVKPGDTKFGNRYFVTGSGINKIIEDFKSGKLFENEN